MIRNIHFFGVFFEILFSTNFFTMLSIELFIELFIELKKCFDNTFNTINFVFSSQEWIHI